MEKSHSPVPAPIKIKEKSMDFTSIIHELVDGKNVRRLEWEDKDIFLTIEDEKLMIFLTNDKKLHPLIVSLGDIVGEDLVVV